MNCLHKRRGAGKGSDSLPASEVLREGARAGRNWIEGMKNRLAYFVACVALLALAVATSFSVGKPAPASAQGGELCVILPATGQKIKVADLTAMPASPGPPADPLRRGRDAHHSGPAAAHAHHPGPGAHRSRRPQARRRQGAGARRLQEARQARRRQRREEGQEEGQVKGSSRDRGWRDRPQGPEGQAQEGRARHPQPRRFPHSLQPRFRGRPPRVRRPRRVSPIS